MGRDHSIECETCGVWYSGLNGPDECNCAAVAQMRRHVADWQDDPDLHAVRWNGHVVLVNRLANLAACLREAAGLTQSWIQGARCGSQWHGDFNDEGEAWSPNTRREAAPGFEGK